MACGVLVPQLGIKPRPPAVEAQSPNRWIARKSTLLEHIFFYYYYLILFIFVFIWLHWVSVPECQLSLVAARGGYSSLQCLGFLLRWLLSLHSKGSREHGLQ